MAKCIKIVCWEFQKERLWFDETLETTETELESKMIAKEWAETFVLIWERWENRYVFLDRRDVFFVRSVQRRYLISEFL